MQQQRILYIDVEGAPLPPRPQNGVVYAQPPPPEPEELDPDARYSIWHGAELLDEFVQCWVTARPEAKAILMADLRELYRTLIEMKHSGY